MSKWKKKQPLPLYAEVQCICLYVCGCVYKASAELCVIALIFSSQGRRAWNRRAHFLWINSQQNAVSESLMLWRNLFADTDTDRALEKHLIVCAALLYNCVTVLKGAHRWFCQCYLINNKLCQFKSLLTISQCFLQVEDSFEVAKTFAALEWEVSVHDTPFRLFTSRF